MVNRRLHPQKFFTREEKDRIVEAIRRAETETSAEIRLFLERKAKGDVMNHAKKIFEKLGMTQTRHRNGILLYFSLIDRSFAILGDRGIHEKVGEGFWKEIVSTIERCFSQDDFTGGLETGIRAIGEKLKKHFPGGAGDTNELPDEIQE